MYIDNIADKLKLSGEKLVPCTGEEVIELEKFYNIRLPMAYKEFLLNMGQYAGENLFSGSDYQYDYLFKLRKWVLEDPYSIDNSSFVWNDDMFIFINHGGYLIYYFVLDGNDNPPVHLYEEAIDDVKQTYSSFSEFLETQYNTYF